VTSDDLPPLYRPKATAELSVFRVEALLREARRHRRLPEQLVPQRQGHRWNDHRLVILEDRV
jgi:hypothetical protein